MSIDFKFKSSLENVYIIAEIGVNHNGQLDLAKKMITAAKNAGANVLVSGSTIFKENGGNLKKNIELLRSK